MARSGVIRLAFYGIGPNGDFNAGIQCVECDMLLEWSEQDCWWECPECRFEVTPTEALFLGKKAIKALKVFNKDQKKKGGKVTWRMLKGKGSK